MSTYQEAHGKCSIVLLGAPIICQTASNAFCLSPSYLCKVQVLVKVHHHHICIISRAFSPLFYIRTNTSSMFHQRDELKRDRIDICVLHSHKLRAKYVTLG